MELLAPNPLHANQPRVLMHAAKPSIESSWKLVDTNILNNPEEVKAQLFDDEASSLAKVIQDTLRSFLVEAEVRPEDISIGPTVIRFGIRPTGKPTMKVDEKGQQVPVKDAAGNTGHSEGRTMANEAAEDQALNNAMNAEAEAEVAEGMAYAAEERELEGFFKKQARRWQTE